MGRWVCSGMVGRLLLPCVRKLVVKVCAELRPRHTECLKHPGKRSRRRVALAAFDASHVCAMYLCAFPQAFLGKSGPVAECAQSTPHRQSHPLIVPHERTLSACIL